MVVALTVLHIALAAAWFGHKLLVPGDIKASVRGDSDPGPFLGRLKRAERVGQLTGVGTLLAGMGLAFAVDASTVGYGVWIGATLVVVTIVIGAVLARPVSNRLKTAVASGDRVTATIAGNRLNRLLGVESLLWLGALTGMVLGS